MAPHAKTALDNSLNCVVCVHNESGHQYSLEFCWQRHEIHFSGYKQMPLDAGLELPT